MSRTMFRKTLIAVSATIALATAALAPSIASAAPHGGHHGGWHGGHGGWHHGGHFRGPRFGVGFSGPAYAYADCYNVRRVVRTPYGPRARLIRVCD